MATNEPIRPRQTLRAFMRWLRSAPQRRYEWQLQPGYWRLRRCLLGVEFWLGKSVFRAKKELRESTESVSIAGGILWAIVGQTVLAVLLVAGLWLLDQHNPKVVAIEINKDIYTSLLSSVAQVSGVFLGLYFTARSEEHTSEL